MKKFTVSTAASGGAIKGANQAGGYLYLHEQNIPVEIAAGTSIGNINSALFAQGDAVRLSDVWLKEIKSTKDIYRYWIPEKPVLKHITNPISYAIGFYKGGLYNSNPLLELIDNYVDPIALIKSKTRFIACAVHKNLSEKIYIEAIPENLDKLKPFIYASAAFPLAFPPLKWEGADFEYSNISTGKVEVAKRGDYFEDGGSMEPTPVEIVARKAKKSKHIIIMSATRDIKVRKELKRNLFSQASNTVKDSMFEEIFRNDFRLGVIKHWGKNITSKKKFKYFSTPDYFTDSFDVSHDKIKKSFADGYEEMRRIITNLQKG